MKFFAEPNHFVRISNKHMQRILGVKGFHFDANGEYETENELLINTLKINFKYEDNTLPIQEEETPLNTQEMAKNDIVEEKKATKKKGANK